MPTRPYLAIDTSTALGSVAVGRGDRLLGEVVVGVTAKHSESLLPAIDFVLRSAGLEPSSLGAVVVGGGPGSFTGVRVAGATAKGLVRALGVPMFAYSGLLALAAGAGMGGGTVCGMFDAKRREVYAAAARFGADGGVEILLEPTVAPLTEVMDELEGDVLYVGDGALRYRSEIEAAGGRVGPTFLAVPRASTLLWLADRDPEGGRIVDPATWEPEYLRASSAERGVQG